MKKKALILIVLDLIVCVLAYLMSKYYIETDRPLLALISLNFSCVFSCIAVCMIGVALIHKYEKRNDNSLMTLSLVALMTCFLSYGIYWVLNYLELAGLLIDLFKLVYYANLIIVIITYAAMFYIWNKNYNKKEIIRFLIIILSSLFFTILFKFLISKGIVANIVFSMILDLLYSMSSILLTIFCLIVFIYLIIFPVRKR